jgi:hypothetical protein
VAWGGVHGRSGAERPHAHETPSVMFED